MKVLFLVFAAVLMSAPAMATETIMNCYTPEETVNKVRTELSDSVEVYALHIRTSDTHRGLLKGWVRGRKANQSADQDANISSNLMMADAHIENGLCRVKLVFDRSKDYCNTTDGRRDGCFYEEMKISFSGDFLNEDGSRDADFYYKNPKSGQSLLAQALGFKSEIPKQLRALKCFADIDFVRGLCQKKRVDSQSTSANK